MADNDDGASRGVVPITARTARRGYLSTGEYIKQVSDAVVNEVLNTRNYESPWKDYIALDIVTIHETVPTTETRDQLIQNFKAMFELMPDYPADILSSTANVDELKGKATVHVHLSLRGSPDGMRRESINVLEWRHNGKMWQIKKLSGMRGPPGDLGPFTGL